jgi:O-antigen ligase
MVESVDRFERSLNTKRLVFIALLLAASAAVLFVLMPASLRNLVIVGLIGLPAAMYLFDKPKALFYILTFLIFSMIYWYIGFFFFQITYIFAFASWAVWAIARRRFVVHDGLFVCLFVAFSILLFQSLVAARDLDGSIYRLKTLALLMAFLFLTIQFVVDRREFRTFFFIVAVAVLVNNFLPMLFSPPQVYGDPSVIASQGVFRFEGLLFEPNLLAFLQIFIIPVFLFFVFFSRRPFVVRPIALLAIMGSVAILGLTFSRGGFLSLVFLFLVLFYLERRNRWVFGFGVALIVAGLLLVPVDYYIRIGSIFNAASEFTEDYPVYSRLQMMKSALQLGIRNPIFGVGLENCIIRSASYATMRLSVHNALLQVFSELGAFALVVFVAIVAYNMRAIRDMLRQSDVETVRLGKILLVQQLAVLMNAMFVPAAYHNILWYAFLLPSLACRAYRMPAPNGKK